MHAAQYVLISAVRFYRWVLSPAKTVLFGPLANCRFEPCCSAYALEAVQAHGALKGTGLALKRLCRCHPWGDFGPDPVPGTSHRKTNSGESLETDLMKKYSVFSVQCSVIGKLPASSSLIQQHGEHAVASAVKLS